MPSPCLETGHPGAAGTLSRGFSASEVLPSYEPLSVGFEGKYCQRWRGSSHEPRYERAPIVSSFQCTTAELVNLQVCGFSGSFR